LHGRTQDCNIDQIKSWFLADSQLFLKTARAKVISTEEQQKFEHQDNEIWQMLLIPNSSKH
jgi:hypothetical protein